MKTCQNMLVCCFLLPGVFLQAPELRASGFAMSANFTVFTGPLLTRNQETLFAEAVLRNAESYRKEIALEWLGQELPAHAGATTVNVAFSDDRDAGLTWAKDDPRRKFHVLYMTTSPDRALGSTLAHEMVHVVFATRFPHPQRLQAWLEEGVASRYDNPERQAIRQTVMDSMRRHRHWPSLEAILTARTIAATQSQSYAVAASLTDFLVACRDKLTLIRFGQTARDVGWNAALEQHYQIKDVAALQLAWQQWVDHADGLALLPRPQANSRR